LTDERRVAIEVELTVKSRRRLTTILDELTGRYDAVLYFCAPASRRVLSELSQTGRWPTLGVRELPVSRPGFDGGLVSRFSRSFGGRVLPCFSQRRVLRSLVVDGPRALRVDARC